MNFIFMKFNRSGELYQNSNIIAEIVAGILAFIISFRFVPAYYSYAIIVFILYFLFDSIKTGGIQFVKPDKWFTLGYCFLYGSLLAAGIVIGDKDGLNLTRQYIYWSLPMWMIGYLGGKYCIKRGFFAGILAGSIVTSIIGIFQKINNPLERIYSFYNYPTQYGVVIALVFPMLIYYACRAGKVKMQIVSVMACILLAFCLVWTDTRATVVSLCTGIVISTLGITFQNRSNFSLKQKVMALMMVLVVSAVGAAGFEHMQDHRDTAIAKAGGERIYMLAASYEMWQDHKIAGIGVSSWEKYYYSSQYHPEGAVEQNLTMPHNMFIYFLSTAGIIGGVGFIAYTIFTLAALLKVPYKEDWLAEWCILTIFIAFFINGMFDSTFINKVPVKIYYAIMGLFMTWGMHDTDFQEKFKDEKS
jgi:O-antigen ligase